MATIPINVRPAVAPRRPGFLSAGFRPFFLLGSAWAAFAIPLWLCVYAGRIAPPGALPPATWHAHEMIHGYGVAAVAGFLLTAIPNWTGRLPLRGTPLAALAGFWLAGRLAVLLSASTGAGAAAAIDLAFPAALVAIVARELLAGRNWRNLPMLVGSRCFLRLRCWCMSRPSASRQRGPSAIAWGWRRSAC